MTLTDGMPVSTIPAVNVASVPQRSPLRYPGGKTWLVPHVRHWLTDGCETLVEPFVGGGIVSLTAVMEGLAERALMVDLDRDVAAFWRSALMHGDELAERLLTFDVTRDSVHALERTAPVTVLDHGFRTLVLNRTRRGGVLAPGAALTRNGENGNGVTSRWYPQTLAARLAAIADHADRLTFCEGDGLAVLEMTAGIGGPSSSPSRGLDAGDVVWLVSEAMTGDSTGGTGRYSHSKRRARSCSPPRPSPVQRSSRRYGPSSPRQRRHHHDPGPRAHNL